MQRFPDRDIRQRDIVPPDRLGECRVTIVGVGAIGRQAAMQMAAIGVPALQLIDFDRVEEANLGCQGFRPSDIGRPKVEAVADVCRAINPETQIATHETRFRRSIDAGNVVFACVDQIDVRRSIWNAVKDSVRIYIDGRMAAEAIRIVTAVDETGRRHYPTTLFGTEQTYSGGCTAKSTIFTASIAAGLMIEQLTRHLRDLPVDNDLMLNLLASEMTILA